MATTHLKKPYSSLYSLLENEKTRYVRKYINRYLYYQYPIIVSGIARQRKKHLSQLHGMPPSRLNNNKRSEKPDHNINYKNDRKPPCNLPTQIQATLWYLAQKLPLLFLWFGKHTKYNLNAFLKSRLFFLIFYLHIQIIKLLLHPQYGSSSVGRALGSKTRCREFEPLLPC